jgi:hypothetical protein
VEQDTVQVKETKRMKEHSELFPEGNHADSENDEVTELSLEQPSPLKIVDTFVSANSGNNS